MADDTQVHFLFILHHIIPYSSSTRSFVVHPPLDHVLFILHQIICSSSSTRSFVLHPPPDDLFFILHQMICSSSSTAYPRRWIRWDTEARWEKKADNTDGRRRERGEEVR
eukprot:GHVS01070019.1.p1 GENE.GHVS01070019.1~~GHVS01070019.1.p1  ORF type:complete len:110 (+),score=23.98 GHVS01070019.1:43-372(+)